MTLFLFLYELPHDQQGWVTGHMTNPDNLVVQLQTEDVLSFQGNPVQHGGEPITDGTHYILAAFLSYEEDNDDDIRECHLDQRV